MDGGHLYWYMCHTILCGPHYWEKIWESNCRRPSIRTEEYCLGYLDGSELFESVVQHHTNAICNLAKLSGGGQELLYAIY